MDNNLIEKRFGRLIIKSIFLDNKSRKHAVCICDCGKEKIFYLRNILKGKSLSCGCYQKERAREANKKYNKYNMSGEYGIGYTNNGVEFYFDLEDFDKIKEYCWCYKENGYIFASQGHHKLPITMETIIIGKAPKKYKIDHVNRNKKDNRKENLRYANNLENARNGNIRKHNKSGFSGVAWHKGANKWEAYITVNWIRIYLGVYKNINDAIVARLKAEKEYFGEFAPQRHLFKEYGIE